MVDVNKKNSKNVRDLLLQRAVAVVEQHGDAAIRVNEIARDCGVPITSLYHYFNNREGLLEAVQAVRYMDFSTRDLKVFAVSFRQCQTLAEFRSLVEATLQQIFTDEQHAAVRRQRLEILGSSAFRPKLASVIGEYQAMYNSQFKEILQVAQDQGWILPHLDLEVVAAFFIGIVNGRVVIEVGDQNFNTAAWDELARSAVMSFIATA